MNIPLKGRKALRKIKTVPIAVKAIIYTNNQNGPKQVVQFHQDVTYYNLYEALLYVESYEARGYFLLGTAQLAADAALQ